MEIKNYYEFRFTPEGNDITPEIDLTFAYKKEAEDETDSVDIAELINMFYAFGTALGFAKEELDKHLI